MAESQRGKKFNDDIKEKAFALLATNNNAKVVADTLGLKYTTVKTWEKKFLKEAEEQQKAKAEAENNQEAEDKQDTNLRTENLVELRNKKKKEFVDSSWNIISKAQTLLERRITRALENEDELDNLVSEIEQLDYKDLSQEQRKALHRKMAAIKVEDVGKLATMLGTLYDKQALANNEATSKVDGVIRIEDIIKKAEGKSDF